MQKTGLIFIFAAIFLVGAFTIDLIFYRPDRHLRQIEKLENVHEDRLGPREDPFLYNRNLGDVTDERFMLNAEELGMAEAGLDYEYEIRDGDTIDELARKYLGRHELKDRLYRENPSLRRGVSLQPGTRITIPFRYRR